MFQPLTDAEIAESVASKLERAIPNGRDWRRAEAIRRALEQGRLLRVAPEAITNPTTPGIRVAPDGNAYCVLRIGADNRYVYAKVIDSDLLEGVATPEQVAEMNRRRQAAWMAEEQFIADLDR